MIMARAAWQPRPAGLTHMAPHPTVIFGRVQDSGGKVVQGARVYLSSGPEPLPDIAILTDQDGSFRLTAPVPGTYTIECIADGFQQTTLTVAVKDIPPEELKFRLVPAN